MISSLTALLIVFAAVIGSTSMAGLIAYLLRRIGRLESQLQDQGGRLLADQVTVMREDLLRVQEEMSSLSERVDFTDKLLMKGDEPSKSTDPQ